MHRTTRVVLSVGISVVTLVLCGCGERARPEPASGDSLPADFGFQQTPQEILLAEGKAAYDIYCIGCHGETGEGNGAGARWLNPPPRNFVDSKYKFISTRFGEYPTDDDLYRSISKGLRGSSMPSWGHLPERTRWALVHYIKEFGRIWWEDDGPYPEIPTVEDPYLKSRDREAAVKRGEAVYHGYFECWTCHPSYLPAEGLRENLIKFTGSAPQTFRDGLAAAAIKETSAGETIYPPDFLRDTVRGGASVQDLYRSIGAGITGTAMPTWIDQVLSPPPGPGGGDPVVSASDLWALAYYVQDLILKKPHTFSEADIAVRDRRLLLEEDAARFAASVND